MTDSQSYTHRSRKKPTTPKNKNPIKKSEKITLIITAVIMGIGAVAGGGLTFLGPLLVILIILDLLAIKNCITSEELKRIIIFFSILGALGSLLLCRIVFVIMTQGLGPF